MMRIILSLPILFGFVFSQDTSSIVEDSLSVSVDSDTTELMHIPISVIAKDDTVADSTLTPLPELLPDHAPSTLQTGEQFFDYQDDILFLQTQIDSLKKLIRVYSKKDTMPIVQKSLLDLIKKKHYSHKIMLENGTMVRGNILEKTSEIIVLDTDIGKLVLDKKYITKIEKELPKTAKINLINDPVIKLSAGKEEITGTVKNIGEKRGDFVRVIANMWGKDTELIAQDSIFVNGAEIEYNNGVISDTAIEPDDSASFLILITYPVESEVSYRTYDVLWTEVE